VHELGLQAGDVEALRGGGGGPAVHRVRPAGHVGGGRGAFSSSGRERRGARKLKAPPNHPRPQAYAAASAAALRSAGSMLEQLGARKASLLTVRRGGPRTAGPGHCRRLARGGTAVAQARRPAPPVSEPTPITPCQVTVFLRDAEAGVAGFTEAWNEWIADAEPPGVMVLQVGRVSGCGGRCTASASLQDLTPAPIHLARPQPHSSPPPHPSPGLRPCARHPGGAADDGLRRPRRRVMPRRGTPRRVTRGPPQ
jgi:hypothetical protein